jgi:hypothetical protein
VSLALALLLSAQAAPRDFLREEQTEALNFSYAWPAAAERDPRLRDLLRGRMEEARERAIADARENQRTARADGFEFHQHEYGAGWEVAGNPVGLISLTFSAFTFSGGAHGNNFFDALLWDDGADREIDVKDFLGREAIEGLGPAYCTELDRMRTERRGAPVAPDPEDPFSRCPPIGEQVLALANRDNNPHFDTLLVLIPPYVAGPYVEGDYVVEVRIDDDSLGHVPERFRSAFFPWGERIRPIPDE